MPSFLLPEHMPVLPHLEDVSLLDAVFGKDPPFGVGLLYGRGPVFRGPLHALSLLMPPLGQEPILA